jgi:hypothetical protein
MTQSRAAKNISEANRISVELLITDARTAITLLDLAETSSIPEHRSRQIREAHHAYETIVIFLARLAPSPEQMEVLNRAIDTLKKRLKVAGTPVD